MAVRSSEKIYNLKSFFCDLIFFFVITDNEVMQWNIRSYCAKKDSLVSLISVHDFKMIVTFFSEKSQPHTKDFDCIRHDRIDGYGGAAVVTHRNLPYGKTNLSQLVLPHTIEVVAVKLVALFLMFPWDLTYARGNSDPYPFCLPFNCVTNATHLFRYRKYNTWTANWILYKESFCNFCSHIPIVSYDQIIEGIRIAIFTGIPEKKSRSLSKASNIWWIDECTRVLKNRREVLKN